MSVFANSEEIGVAIVDPFSTGAIVAQKFQQAGYKLVIIYSAQMDRLENLTHMVPDGIQLDISAYVFFDPSPSKMIEAIRKLRINIVAVVAGTETGVELSDILSELLGLASNGTALSEARRNKFLMGETVRNAGLRSVYQRLVHSWGEVTQFLEEWHPNPFEVIIKPLDSAGGEDVTLCRDVKELEKAYFAILGKVNGLGITNTTVLIQEYLDGTEYVVDTASRDGEHKVVHVMSYDRRKINGAGFVMAGDILQCCSDLHCQEIVNYQKKVITALGIRHGAAHAEIKYCRGEPVLVEVGARCHGMEGIWQPVTSSVYGHDQIEATVAAYVDAAGFAALPSEVCNHTSMFCFWLRYLSFLRLISLCLAYKERKRRPHSVPAVGGGRHLGTHRCFRRTTYQSSSLTHRDGLLRQGGATHQPHHKLFHHGGIRAARTRGRVPARLRLSSGSCIGDTALHRTTVIDSRTIPWWFARIFPVIGRCYKE